MQFGTLNWLILAAFLLATTLVGHLLKGKQKGLQQYFLGGGQLPWWAVSASIMVSQLSAVTIIAVPGFVFRPNGSLAFLQGTLIGVLLAKLLMITFFIGPYYEQRVYSPYDFICKRLGQGPSQIASSLFVVGAILGHGVRLLTVSLVLSVVVDVRLEVSVFIIGAFAVLWTLMGGITTVVWTDVVQFFMVVVGAIVAAVYLIGAFPEGVSGAYAQWQAHDKLHLWDLSLDPSVTWTVWTALICFTIYELAQNSVDQVITQRIMCCRNANDARKAVLGSVAGIVVAILMAAIGLGLWTFYQENPLDIEAAAILADQPSRAYPFYVVHQLPNGVSGLIIAAIFAAGISTLDSALLALAETSANNFYRLYVNPSASESHYLRVSRFAVIVWGLVLSGLAYLFAQFVASEALLNLAYKAPIITYGPMLMIACCAIMRWGSMTIMLTAAIASVAVSMILVALSMQGKLSMDLFWCYPISCLVFLTAAKITATITDECTHTLADDDIIMSDASSSQGIRR